MSPYVMYGIPDEQWVETAHSSRTMKAAIEAVGVTKYTTWLALAKKHRPDLVEAMRAELSLNRERAHLPRCKVEGCGRPVKARGMCKRDYEIWLAGVTAGEKVKRADYPSDDQIAEWFELNLSMAKAALRIGVARETLRDYIDHRPHLKALYQQNLQRQLDERSSSRPQRQLRAKWDQRRYAAQRRDRDPERVREINRRWARNQHPIKRRYWNNYNRMRRASALSDLTPEMRRESSYYQQVLQGDPCVYCGEPSASVDHIRPINSGGAGTWENLAGACRRCNSQKNDAELLHYMLWRLEHDASPGGGVPNPIVEPVGC